MFFANRGEVWEGLGRRSGIDLQDPFITRINNEIVFGGVEVFPSPQDPRETCFSEANSITN